ncbi:hypothetical protein BMETH_1395_1 [methanotrophic bacterial endosymbiont of Bathymodiolus sp.]|nr:hypothetical protein BMETH_1395_1 [methanotrophic bacterial endosymbiont of Bathymodiolus sp.]
MYFPEATNLLATTYFVSPGLEFLSIISFVMVIISALSEFFLSVFFSLNLNFISLKERDFLINS